jgi:hypothetical protein
MSDGKQFQILHWILQTSYAVYYSKPFSKRWWQTDTIIWNLKLAAGPESANIKKSPDLYKQVTSLSNPKNGRNRFMITLADVINDRWDDLSRIITTQMNAWVVWGVLKEVYCIRSFILYPAAEIVVLNDDDDPAGLNRRLILSDNKKILSEKGERGKRLKSKTLRKCSLNHDIRCNDYFNSD